MTTEVQVFQSEFQQESIADFQRLTAMEYKFYLAFENALCPDYVTEKFFRTLKLPVVPVVMGGDNYKNLVPPGSFIDVNNFK